MTNISVFDSDHIHSMNRRISFDNIFNSDKFSDIVNYIVENDQIILVSNNAQDNDNKNKRVHNTDGCN